MGTAGEVTMKEDSIQRQVKAINDNDTGELGRLIKLTVQRFSADIPEVVITRRRRHIAPRVIEMTRQDATELRDYLTKCLKDEIPGTISYLLFGREEL